MDRIINILNNCGADAWEITDVKTHGWEFYFIGHRLDQNRAKDVEHITIKVYKQSADGQFLGSASAEVPPTANDEEMRKTVSDLVYQASLVRNKTYSLCPARPYEKIFSETVPIADDAEAFIRAMSSIKAAAAIWITACTAVLIRRTEPTAPTMPPTRV